MMHPTSPTRYILQALTVGVVVPVLRLLARPVYLVVVPIERGTAGPEAGAPQVRGGWPGDMAWTHHLPAAQFVFERLTVVRPLPWVQDVCTEVLDLSSGQFHPVNGPVPFGDGVLLRHTGGSNVAVFKAARFGWRERRRLRLLLAAAQGSPFSSQRRRAADMLSGILLRLLLFTCGVAFGFLAFTAWLADDDLPGVSPTRQGQPHLATVEGAGTRAVEDIP